MLNRVEYQVQTYHCVFFLLFFLRAYTLFINKSYSNEKLKGMNKLPQITNEHMKPHPMRQPLKLKSLNQCQMI